MSVSVECIVNLTPHAITIPVTAMPEFGPWTLPPSGQIARAIEKVISAPTIGYVPTTYVVYDGVEGLPAPQWNELPHPCEVPGAVHDGQCFICGACDNATPFRHVPGNPRAPAVYYVVSSITADAARRTGRTTEDLLTPGEQIRDESGRIVGCRSLARVR